MIEAPPMADAPPRPTFSPIAWFLNPYVQIGFAAVLAAGSEILMKKGAVAVENATGSVGIFGIAALASGWVWAGIVTYILGFISWIYVLRFVPLGVAYALINLDHVLIPLGAWAVLGEKISPRRGIGILIVLLGLYLIIRPLARMEEKL